MAKRRDNLQVYRDILHVYENWGDDSQDTDAQAELRERASSSEKALDTFFQKTVLTAAEKLERFNPSSDDAIVEEETRSIQELERTLDKWL